jgi:phosphatidylglycerophosphatase A
MRNRLIQFIASGFGAGYAPVAPGTVGSLLGVGYWWLLTRGNVWVYWLAFAAGVVFAVWCAGEAAEALRRPDPRCVVIDEIAAMPLALAGLGVQPWKIAVGFVCFRAFDVWKPAPVRQAEIFSGGIGIVLDDLFAAVYACGATHAVVWVVERIGHQSF